ncbi:MAG TPA: PQQ-dependent sugar dehydrogenase, partial [Chloroflexota bacterium]|nr:PQQ-dependent sugar dehydrogenase [Chloroflexota bacterium]
IVQPPRFGRLISAFSLVAALGVAVLGLSSGPLASSQPAFSLKLQAFAKGFRQPLDFRSANDGSDRLYVVEKQGIIRLLHGSTPVERPFLDIRSLVGASGSEQGLLGLALDPNYAATGFFFVNYTDRNGDSVVARYQVSSDADVADPASSTIVLFQKQPYANHNGGNLVFGPDSYLYIGFGDGGNGGDPHGNGQSTSTWLGKLLRLDVSALPYGIPADNPFVGTAGALPEIWATGLRNPWRYSFDRLTGDLLIGDVGQDQWEEVDYVAAGSAGGLNFGWNIAEGNHCYRSSSCNLSPFVPAAAEYSHGRGDCAVIGGYVYRGSMYPALNGVYLYGDECSGRMWALTRDAGGAWSTTDLGKQGVSLSSFGEDDSGEMYVTGFDDGTIYRITTS